jgi:hypothetical protein
MVEDVPASRQTAVAVTAVTSGNLSDTLAGTNPGENGYITENQRFLHVLGGGGTSKNVEIYGYNYAFAQWSVLMIKTPNAAGYEAMKATTGGSGGVRQYTFDIAGVDRVAFVTTSTPTVVRAACSTF